MREDLKTARGGSARSAKTYETSVFGFATAIFAIPATVGREALPSKAPSFCYSCYCAAIDCYSSRLWLPSVATIATVATKKAKSACTTRCFVYTRNVSETTDTGFSSPTSCKRINRAERFFYAYRLCAPLLWVSFGGGASRLAGCLRDRSANPAICSPTPFSSGTRVNYSRRGRIMRQANHARTGQVSPAITEFIARDALKRAALAPTSDAALDIVGEALAILASITKREASHV
jgi:hypothetical protein